MEANSIKQKDSKNKCEHSLNHRMKIDNIDNFYLCKNCGIIIFNFNEDKYLYTLKPILYEGKTEIFPNDLFEQMRKEEFTPIDAEHAYNKNREKALKIFDENCSYVTINDVILYKALNFMDYIFIRLGNKNLKIKSITLYIINAIVFATEAYKNDEIGLNKFSVLDISYTIDELDIKRNEIRALKLLQYNLNKLGVYDVLVFLLHNGIVFDKELEDKSAEFCSFIYNYALKLFKDIIRSHICLLYHTCQIAFSIVHLTRKKFDLNIKYFKILKMLYNYKASEYKECLGAVQQIIDG